MKSLVSVSFILVILFTLFFVNVCQAPVNQSKMKCSSSKPVEKVDFFPQLEGKLNLHDFCGVCRSFPLKKKKELEFEKKWPPTSSVISKFLLPQEHRLVFT